MATRKTQATETLDFISVEEGQFRAYLLGQTPLVCNAMSAKVIRTLLVPPGRKTPAQKLASEKHNVIEEFNDSIYRSLEDDAPTLITIKATAIKNATMGAAVDIPGTTKAKMGRLMRMYGTHKPDYLSVYGIPEMMMSVTRCQDMNHTPDVRTRAIIPNWCAVVDVRHTEPMLKGPVVAKLMAAAGLTQGLGDWRTEKGSGNYGAFRLAEKDDPLVKLIMEAGGRKEQIAAMENPAFYDSETENLYSWYQDERVRRGFKKAS